MLILGKVPFVKKRVTYSAESKAILLGWVRSNMSNPYATSKAKSELALKTQLSEKQVTMWLLNTRKSEWFRKEMEEYLSRH